MKKLGLIGGLSWQSTLEYYREINTMVKERLGGNNAAELFLHSLNFGEIQKLQASGQWDLLERIIVDAAKGLQGQGAEAIMICANTMHKVADQLERNVQVPLIHIADATAAAIREKGLKKVALLGTTFTMTEDFYKTRLLQKHGIECLVPSNEEIEFIHHAIYNELMSNIFLERTKSKFQEIIGRLGASGAEGVILGCTEIPLLLKPEECPIPGFDSMRIHAKAAVDFSLGPQAR